MRAVITALSLILLTTLLSGCGTDEGFVRQTPPAGLLRVVNTVFDSPTLTAEFENQRVANVNFGETSQFSSVLPEVPRTFRLLYVDEQQVQTLIAREITIPIDHVATVFVTGTMANPGLTVVIDETRSFAADATIAEVRALNTATNAPASVDFSFAGATNHVHAAAFGTLTPGADLTTGENYTLTVRDGATDLLQTVPFLIAAQSQPIYTLIDRNGPGNATTRMILVSEVSGFAIADNQDGAIRFGNFVPDRTSLDFYIDGALVAEDVLYGELRDYVGVAQATVNLQATIANDPSTVLGEAEHAIFGGEFQSAFAIGAAEQTDLIVTGDDRRQIAVRARIEVSHLAFSGEVFDVYVLRQGQTVDQFAPSLGGLGYQSTGSLQIDAGTYNLFLTGTSTNNVIVGPQAITVSDRGLYRAIVGDADGSGEPLQFFLVDDFTN